MKILAEEEEEEEDYHPQLQDVELSHPPSLTYRLGQDDLSSVHFDPNDNTDSSSSSSSSSIASVTEYYDDDEYSISAGDGDEEEKDNTTGCSSHPNKNSICTAICHQLGAVAGRCSHTPKYRRSTVIKNKGSPAYVVICRSLLIFALITTIAAVIIVNSLSSSSSSSLSPSPSQPSPSPLSPQSHTIMDTEPHSEGEYHYEGIGHNVLEPHTIGTPSPPTTTAITYPMEGKPHQDDAHHYYESISHTILPVTSGLSTNNGSSSASSSSSVLASASASASTSTSTTTSNSVNVNTYTNEVTSASVHAVVIPFANHYNLYFDGILFVKNATLHDDHFSSSTTITTSTTQSQSQQYDFDSYAKTLDPVTEIHFSPGESTNTKQIVLSTIPPDLSHDSNSNNSKGNGAPVMNVEHSALTIGLNSNGGLWFPHFTGESMYDLPRNDDAVSLFGNKNDNDNGNKKMYYGAGDRFVLKITNKKNSADNDNNNDSHHDSLKKKNMMQLYRNNNRLEFIGEWVNPKPNQNLYGQIWFKDPNSSMFAYAINDRTNNNNDNNNNNNNNTTNGNDSNDEEEDEEGKSRNFRQRSLLRGRRDYFHEKYQENL